MQRASACGFSIENNGITKGYVALGQAQTVPYLNDLWEFDPLTESWTQKADFIGPPRRQAVSFVISDKAYVGTGEGLTGLYNDFYVYDSQSNTWDQVASFPGTARKQAVSFSLAGNGFVGTGDDGTKRNDFWMYNPQTDAWILKAQFPGIARSGACSWSSYPSAFVGTGEGIDYSFLKDLYEYNYYTNSWVQRANLPGPPRKNAISFCIDGIGYLGTGYNNEFLDDFYAYYKIADVAELEENQIQIYPNPTQSLVQIDGGEDMIRSLKLLNAAGATVIHELPKNQSLYELNIQSLPSGKYQVVLEKENGRIQAKSIIKL
jgi:N-acetylneuraminic acid mutarotase